MYIHMSTNTERYVAKTVGPSSIPGKNKGNNAVLSNKHAMPQKFGSAFGGSMFARARKVYSKDAGGGEGYHDSFCLYCFKAE